MGMTRHNASLAIFFTIFAGCLAGEYCSYSNVGGGGVQYLYCDVTCCGYYYSRYCCTFTSTALYVGAISGAVICIALVIGILVCCIYKGKTPVRRHRNINNSTSNDQFQCSRIYRHDSPKPPPYSIHHLHPPEYHEDPPPRYLTPIPGSEYHNIPGTMADS
ncbi:uncharacterized protein LOC125659052 [Ostrea edulis]|uniref:uncharacterized protein LOC125659052 n=1 Tax=Ostrea edulis TaxID=37623 RepID=UPI0024AED126|nr:uncharacterized protein LOC125659052 [Ostrea edulis]